MALKELDKSPEWYKRVPAQIGAGVVEGLGVPGSLIDIAQNALVSGARYVTGGRGKTYEEIREGQLRVPTVEDIRKNVTEPIFGKELLKPQSFPEEVIGSVAQSVPAIAATGGLSTIPQAATSIGRGLLGATAATGAKELGLPAPVQFFAGIAGEKGFDKILNRAFKTNIPKQTLATMADDAKKQFYAKEQELGSKIKLEAKPFKNSLSEIQKKVSRDTRLSEAERNQLLRDIDQYSSDFIQDKLPASALSTRRKELNYNIANSKGPAKNYYQALVNPVRSVIESEGKLHPQWYKDLKAGDAIHDAQNFRQTFVEGLTDYPKIQKALTNPLAYGAATFGPSLFWTRDPLASLGYSAGVTVGSYALGKPISKGLDLWGFISQGEPRELLLKASEEMIKRNYPAALRTYSRLNQKAEQYEKRTKKMQDSLKSKSTKRLVPIK